MIAKQVWRSKFQVVAKRVQKSSSFILAHVFFFNFLSPLFFSRFFQNSRKGVSQEVNGANSCFFCFQTILQKLGFAKKSSLVLHIVSTSSPLFLGGSLEIPQAVFLSVKYRDESLSCASYFSFLILCIWARVLKTFSWYFRKKLYLCRWIYFQSIWRHSQWNV